MGDGWSVIAKDTINLVNRTWDAGAGGLDGREEKYSAPIKNAEHYLARPRPVLTRSARNLISCIK
jgi:hypothetical protein